MLGQGTYDGARDNEFMQKYAFTWFPNPKIQAIYWQVNAIVLHKKLHQIIDPQKILISFMVKRKGEM